MKPSRPCHLQISVVGSRVHDPPPGLVKTSSHPRTRRGSVGVRGRRGPSPPRKHARLARAVPTFDLQGVPGEQTQGNRMMQTQAFSHPAL